ncbi:zinc ribbon-containing protein (plasmid) [Bacillus tropicus]|nr:zinc ribbon-containing protein [Bacillus tropicus]QIE40469.1 zinc ribbon-containing protein [Bacillus tropicus]
MAKLFKKLFNRKQYNNSVRMSCDNCGKMTDASLPRCEHCGTYH